MTQSSLTQSSLTQSSFTQSKFRRSLAVAAVCVVPLLLWSPPASGAVAASWTDRNEYDMVLAIRAEASPQKRMGLLDQWKAKYPKTELQQVRQELYLSSYQSLGDSAHMLGVAREVLTERPDSLVGLYWCALLLPEAKDAPADLLDAGEKAARQLLSGLDTYFSAEAKPPAMDADGWQKRRIDVELLAHRALGWIQWQRGDYASAGQEFTKCLQLDQNNGEISAWFGTVLTLGKQPQDQVPALWHMARAASYREAGALPESQRRQLGTVLERLYTTYRGEPTGLDRLRTASVAAAFPPAGFHIESATAAAARRQDEELSLTNPQLASWMRIRRHLEATDGEAYFAQSLHQTALPMRLKGTLLRASPANRPKELFLAVGDATAEEVVLKLETALPNGAEPGTVLEFEGTVDAFTRAPFALTVVTIPGKIAGWPGRQRSRQ